MGVPSATGRKVNLLPGTQRRRAGRSGASSRTAHGGKHKRDLNFLDGLVATIPDMILAAEVCSTLLVRSREPHSS